MKFQWSSLGIVLCTLVISKLSYAVPAYSSSHQLAIPKPINIVPGHLSKNDFHILFGSSSQSLLITMPLLNAALPNTPSTPYAIKKHLVIAHSKNRQDLDHKPKKMII